MSISSIVRDLSLLTGQSRNIELVKLGIVHLISVLFELTTIVMVFLFVRMVVFNDVQGEELIVKASGVIVYIIFGAFFRVYSTKRMYDFSLKIEREISSNLLRSYFSNSFIWHKKNNSAELGKTILQDSSQIVSGYVLPMLTVFISLSVVIALGSLGIYLAPSIVGIFFGLLTLFVLFVTLVNKPILRKLSRVKEIAAKSRYSFVSDVFSNRPEIYLETDVSELVEDMGKINDGYCYPQSKYLTLVSVPLQFIEALILLMIVVLVVLSSIYSEQTSLTDQLIISAIIVARILPHFNRLSGAISTLNYHQGLVKSVSDKIVSESESKVQYSSLKNFKVLKVLNGVVSIDGNCILSNLNVEIRRGDKILISGESGSGKSTLVELIAGLIDLSQGQYYLDDRVKPSNEVLKDLVGYVPQNIFLQDRTMRDIVSDGGDLNEKLYLEIMSSLGLIEVEVKLNGKTIGENGNRLSGGQRQRLGIARALFRRKEIIILDESTSGLDPKLERSVIEYIMKFENKTVVMISHTQAAKEIFRKKIEFIKNGNKFDIKTESFGDDRC